MTLQDILGLFALLCIFISCFISLFKSLIKPELDDQN